MIRIGILGDIGSGKSYIAKNFGYPVFNADKEVGKLYKKNRKIFNKLQKALPKYLFSFPVDKKEITKAILANKTNLRKIITIVHAEVRKKMNIFLRNNRNKKIIIFIKLWVQVVFHNSTFHDVFRCFFFQTCFIFS